MKKEFSAYEFTGVIVPGAALLLGLGLIFQPFREFITTDKFDLGELGLFVIASYVCGHLIQGVGNLLEKLVWLGRGMPTTWIRRSDPPFLSPEQVQLLRERLSSLLGFQVGELASLTLRSCDGMRGQLYARLSQAGRTERLDAFNANYGLFRGLASALLVTAIVSILMHSLKHPVSIALMVCTVVSLLRMNRFGVHYAAELYRQALNLSLTVTERPAP